jgi:hypothetical protein
MFQNAPANKGAAQVEECFMDRGQSFVAYAQSPELMQPGDGAFHHPPGLAQVAAMRSSAFGNLVSDAALLQCQAACTTVVSTIGLNGLGLFQWPPALSPNRVDAIDQWQQLRHVLPVGFGQNDIDLDALRVDEDVCLLPALRRSVGFGPVFSAMHSPYRRTFGNDTGEIALIGATQFIQQHTVQLAPYAGLLPGTHPAPTGHTRATPHFLRQHFLQNSRLQNKQDARQYAPIV